MATADDAPATTDVALDDFRGDWSGTLEVMGQALPLVLHVEPGADPAVTLDSPAQGAFGLPADAEIVGDALVATWSSLGATYTASLSKDRNAISGTFAQSGLELRLRMTKGEAALERPDRPQAILGTPPYEQVTGQAQGPDGVRLAYTLTLPEKADPTVPAVVLITGSGPQDRDETLMGHKPFAVLADRLTRRGIAVIRYDDRGVGKSTGTFDGATSRDFAEDASAVIAELRRVAEARGLSLGKTGLLGHSEGGIVAALAATETGAAPDFIVSLAGPFVPLGDILVRQTEDALLGGAVPAEQRVGLIQTQQALIDAATGDGPPEDICAAVSEAATSLPQSAQEQAQAFCAPWFYEILRIDPAVLYGNVDVPVLALFGRLDRQVAADVNAEAARAVEGVDVRVLDGVNHLFQPAQTGQVAEYATIEETMDEAVPELIADWITEGSADR